MEINLNINYQEKYQCKKCKERFRLKATLNNHKCKDEIWEKIREDSNGD